MPSKTFFFLYGAQKSGTTWLSKHLLETDQIYNAGVKEWRLWESYFSSDHDRSEGIKRVKQRIQSNIDRGAIGETRKFEKRLKMRQDPEIFLRASAKIVTSSNRYHVLADFTPSTGIALNESQLRSMSMLVQELGLSPKALYLLRDPLQRAVSELSMLVGNGRRSSFRIHEKPETEEYSREMDRIIENNVGRLTYRSRSEVIIERARAMEASIPFQTIIFDELFSQKTLDRVARFLSLEKINIDQERINHHDTPQLSEASLRSLALSLRPTYQYLKSYFGDQKFPHSWSKSLDYFNGDL